MMAVIHLDTCVSLSLSSEEAWQHLRLRVCEGEEIRSNSDVRGGH